MTSHSYKEFINEEVLLNNTQPYREALKKSGFRDELAYVELKISEERNNQKRNENEKLVGSIRHTQRMSRLTSVRYSSNYYINIFRHHIHSIKFLTKSQLRKVRVVCVA